MAGALKIDFVSDVSCPWCIIGLRALEDALTNLDEISADIHFKPFELNPDMPPEGQNLDEHIAQKYGSTPEQSAANREMIRQRGEALGFRFDMDKLERIYNTFDTHRILHWAELEGCQSEMKHALFDAYFTAGQNPGDHTVLLSLVERLGLDVDRAAEILGSDEFGAEVREQQAFYHRAGIHAVPAVIINDRHLIQGGQPTEVFEQALRQLANDTGN